MLQLSQRLPVGATSGWLLCPFNVTPFECPPAFVSPTMFQASFELGLPQTWRQCHSPRESSAFRERAVRNQTARHTLFSATLSATEGSRWLEVVPVTKNSGAGCVTDCPLLPRNKQSPALSGLKAPPRVTMAPGCVG